MRDVYAEAVRSFGSSFHESHHQKWQAGGTFEVSLTEILIVPCSVNR